VLTCDIVDAHIGKIGATPNHKLILLFLGTTHANAQPRPIPILRELGWKRCDFYEVSIDGYKSDGSVASWRTVYTAETAKESLQSAIRYAKARTEKVKALLVSVVRYGEIGPEGHPEHVRGDALYHWTEQMPKSLEETFP
jgi:hypothetical protein